MNSPEVAKLLAYLQVAYPNSKIEPSLPAIKLWSKHMLRIPFEMAMDLADSMIATNPYPPNIANFQEAYAKAISEARGDLTAGEAWAKVFKAIQRYGTYEPGKAHKELGEFLWSVVEQTGGWLHLCLSEQAQVDSAQFERRYNAMLERQKYRTQVPLAIQDGLKKTIAAMDMNKQLEGMDATKLLGDGSEDDE